MTHWVPELLSPAGSLEKLKTAVLYGAGAVYLGGEKFGLRSAADNFSETELEEGVQFAHERGSKAYVVLNSFLHDSDLEELPEFLKILERLKIDAVIVSDLGVVNTIREHSCLVIHLSTQASCLNSMAALIWKKAGVQRIVLGREVSIDEARMIKEVSGLEIEMFIHGSMCMAFSGNCVISNYTQGRDSNRGGCAHSCRFEYSLDLPNGEKKKATFMSSKDLEGLRQLEQFIDAGIESLKVEGRMKSNHYAGTISKIYAEALRYYKKHGHFLSDDLDIWEKELAKVSHRDYSSGSLESAAGADSIFTERENLASEYTVSAIVVETLKDHSTIVDVRSAFRPQDILELVPFEGESISFKVNDIESLSGQNVDKTKPGTLVRLPYMKEARAFNILRSKGRL